MENLLLEYDDIIIGKRNSFSNELFTKDQKSSQTMVLKVFRYAFKTYLKWPADKIATFISKELLVKMHLWTLVKYIKFPPGYDSKSDLYYIVTLIFPQKRLSIRDKAIHVYERMLQSEKKTKYPKDYFMGADGIVRAGCCFQYALNNLVEFYTINDIFYDFTGYDSIANLKKIYLNNATSLFDSLTDFVNFTLPEENKNPFYYHYYKFKEQIRKMGSISSKMQTGLKKTNNYKLTGGDLD